MIDDGVFRPSEDDQCVRCENAPAVSDGLCAHCTWLVKAEVVEGLLQIDSYLSKWAAFTEYLYERDPRKRERRLEQRRRRSWMHRGVAA